MHEGIAVATPPTGNDAIQDRSLNERLSSFWSDDGRTIDIGVGRDIGFDFARLGIVLPDGTPAPVVEGYAEGRHAYRNRHEQSVSYERKLVRLRLSAYKRNRVIDPMVTPAFLSSIDVRYCPITRMELTSGTGTSTDATVDRIFNGGGYAIGNIAVMSMKANQAKGALLPLEILEIAKKEEPDPRLSEEEWMRLACLTALAAPPGYPSVHLPLFVYPPSGVLLTNSYTLIQQCTAAVCAGYLPARWESELRAALEGKSSKKKFSQYMEALIGQISQKMKWVRDAELQHFAICDCWESDLVMQRYTALITGLSRTEVTSLVSVASRAQQSLTKFSPEQLERWSINTSGYAPGRSK